MQWVCFFLPGDGDPENRLPCQVRTRSKAICGEAI